MDLALLGGSVAAVLALGGLAHVLRLGGGEALTSDDAMREAEDSLAGFDAVSATVSRDGQVALVDGRDGLALVRAHGANRVVRRVLASQIHVEDDRLIVDVGEVIFGRTTLELAPGEAAGWASRRGS